VTKLETRRDYLVRMGLAKPGRGKFSNDAKAALAKADEEGIEFLDGPSPKGNGTGPVKSSLGSSSPVVKPVTETPYLTPDEYRYPEAEWSAFCMKDGKKVIVSLRECCNSCRVSLVNHSCNTPTIHNNVPVTIVGKGAH